MDEIAKVKLVVSPYPCPWCLGVAVKGYKYSPTLHKCSGCSRVFRVIEGAGR